MTRNEAQIISRQADRGDQHAAMNPPVNREERSYGTKVPVRVSPRVCRRDDYAGRDGASRVPQADSQCADGTIKKYMTRSLEDRMSWKLYLAITLWMLMICASILAAGWGY